MNTSSPNARCRADAAQPAQPLGGERDHARYSFFSACRLPGFFLVLSSCTVSNAVAVELDVQLVRLVRVAALERQAGEEDQARPGLDPAHELGQALQVDLADLEVDVVLDVAAPGRRGRALARLGDLDVLLARGRLEIAGQLRRRRRRCAPPATALRALASRYSSRCLAIAASASRMSALPSSRSLMLLNTKQAPSSTDDDHHRGRQDRDPAPLARRHAAPTRRRSRPTGRRSSARRRALRDMSVSTLMIGASLTGTSS